MGTENSHGLSRDFCQVFFVPNVFDSLTFQPRIRGDRGVEEVGDSHIGTGSSILLFSVTFFLPWTSETVEGTPHSSFVRT